MSPRRSVLASIAAGCSLAAAVVAGGYAASGTMPFSQWPDGILASADAPEVALAPASRGEAPVLTLPLAARESATRTKVIPLDEAAATPSDERVEAQAQSRTRARTLPQTEAREPKTPDEVPDSSPTTTPVSTTKTEAPVAAASPAAEAAPSQPASATPSTRRVTLTSPTATFASAAESDSGQPELKVQMAVADAATTGATTVALSLKLAPTDVQALMRTAQAVTTSNIALEAEVDVVDATVATDGEPVCAEGTCLRVQMKFAADTRPETADEPQVEVLDDGTSLSNRVKVVVQIDPEDIGGMKPTKPSDPDAEPAPEAGTPTVLSLPLPAPDGAGEPTTDTATVSVPETNSNPGTPSAPTVQVEAQLEVVDEPAAPHVPQTPAPETTTTPQDCPPEQAD